jgi:hypothetical protein
MKMASVSLGGMAPLPHQTRVGTVVSLAVEQRPEHSVAIDLEDSAKTATHRNRFSALMASPRNSANYALPQHECGHMHPCPCNRLAKAGHAYQRGSAYR